MSNVRNDQNEKEWWSPLNWSTRNEVNSSKPRFHAFSSLRSVHLHAAERLVFCLTIHSPLNLSRTNQSPCLRRTLPSPLPLASPPRHPGRALHQCSRVQLLHLLHRPRGQTLASQSLQRSAVTSVRSFYYNAKTGWRCTSCKSFPFSSEINESRRSSSASIPTDERTPLMSSAEGEVLPPRPKRRYAARCFILIDWRNLVSPRRNFQSLDGKAYIFGS